MKNSVALRLLLTLMVICPLAMWGANTKFRNATIINSTLDNSPVGATTPSTGAFTGVTDTALSTGCVGNTGGVLVSNTNCSAGLNLAFTSQNLAANVSFTESPQTIDTIVIPMSKFANCGSNQCRIRIYASYFIKTNASGYCYATDGTNNWFPSVVSPTSGSVSNLASCTIAFLTPTQYSSGAGQSISVIVIGGNSSGNTVCTSSYGAASPCPSPTGGVSVPSLMQAEVLQSF